VGERTRRFGSLIVPHGRSVYSAPAGRADVGGAGFVWRRRFRIGDEPFVPDLLKAFGWAFLA
jgi:hypothetical protein